MEKHLEASYRLNHRLENGFRSAKSLQTPKKLGSIALSDVKNVLNDKYTPKKTADVLKSNQTDAKKVEVADEVFDDFAPEPRFIDDYVDLHSLGLKKLIENLVEGAHCRASTPEPEHVSDDEDVDLMVDLRAMHDELENSYDDEYDDVDVKAFASLDEENLDFSF